MVAVVAGVVASLTIAAGPAYVEAHNWGWGQQKGTSPTRVRAFMTAQSYSGVQYLMADMWTRSASGTYGNVTASCSTFCSTGVWTNWVTYSSGWQSMSRHCAKASDGHRTPDYGNIPLDHACSVNVGHYALRNWASL